MSNTSTATLVWRKYKEPPKQPDSKWILETVRGAFALSIVEKPNKQNNGRKYHSKRRTLKKRSR